MTNKMMAPRPGYLRVKPERTLDEIAKSAMAIMRKPLVPGSDARRDTELKIRQ